MGIGPTITPAVSNTAAPATQSTGIYTGSSASTPVGSSMLYLHQSDHTIYHAGQDQVTRVFCSCDMSTSTTGSTGTVPIPTPIQNNTVGGRNWSWRVPGEYCSIGSCLVLPLFSVLSHPPFSRALLRVRACLSRPCCRHEFVICRIPRFFPCLVAAGAWDDDLSRSRFQLELPATHISHLIPACPTQTTKYTTFSHQFIRQPNQMPEASVLIHEK